MYYAGGAVYDIRLAPFTRSLDNDEVLGVIGAAFGGITYIVAIWVTIGFDDNDELTNAIELCRFSSLGSGGLAGVDKPREEGQSNYSGTSNGNDAGGWTDDPNFIQTFGGARPFQVNAGFHWEAGNGPGLVVPNDTTTIGYRIVRGLGSKTIHHGMTIVSYGTP